MTWIRRPSYLGQRLALLAGLVLLAFSITQCRMVTDSLVRAQTGESKANSCIKICAEAAKASMKTETDLHKANVAACGSDATCKAQEEARHTAAVAAIEQQRLACQAACHRQGSGQGGR